TGANANYRFEIVTLLLGAFERSIERVVEQVDEDAPEILGQHRDGGDAFAVIAFQRHTALATSTDHAVERETDVLLDKLVDVHHFALRASAARVVHHCAYDAIRAFAVHAYLLRVPAQRFDEIHDLRVCRRIQKL